MENTLFQSFRKYVPFCSLFSLFQSTPSFPLFLLSYALFHCRGETPVNWVGSKLSLSRHLMLQTPKTSSKTQTNSTFMILLFFVCFSRSLQITHFYYLASLQTLVLQPLPSLNLHCVVKSSTTQTSFPITGAKNLVLLIA